MINSVQNISYNANSQKYNSCTFGSVSNVIKGKKISFNPQKISDALSQGHVPGVIFPSFLAEESSLSKKLHTIDLIMLDAMKKGDMKTYYLYMLLRKGLCLK